MPSDEYTYTDNINLYEDCLDIQSKVSVELLRKNEDTFTKVQKRNKRKNRVVIGQDEYGNDKCIYGSKGQGTHIYSATSGYTTTYKVGSFNEHLFFSVIDSRACDTIKEPITFYFDSPEQFERVMECSISQKTKEVWHKKFLISKNRIVNERVPIK
jgi:hypothetical protein